ncbi:MAG: hypothetical protein ABFS19_04595 [Thermodesulfobacteriota bacterium]
MGTENENLNHLLELCQELIELAVEGSEAAGDDGCLLLYGLVQDYAYKMRKAAKSELAVHEQRQVRDVG